MPKTEIQVAVLANQMQAVNVSLEKIIEKIETFGAYAGKIDLLIAEVQDLKITQSKQSDTQYQINKEHAQVVLLIQKDIEALKNTKNILVWLAGVLGGLIGPIISFVFKQLK